MQADTSSCLAEHCSNRLARGAIPLCSHALAVEMLQNSLYLRDASMAKVDTSHLNESPCVYNPAKRWSYPVRRNLPAAVLISVHRSIQYIHLPASANFVILLTGVSMVQRQAVCKQHLHCCKVTLA